MSLQHRIMIVLRGSDSPVTSGDVARVLGLAASTVSSPLSKLCAYGKAEVVATDPRIGQRGCSNRRRYRATRAA